MSNFRSAQANFSKGVLAPHLHGRFDVDAYTAGVRVGNNVLVLKYGGLTKRPGTHLVAEVLDYSEPNRLFPFQFSLTQTYALEMGQGYMSPCAMGGRLIETELKITAITNAAAARITAAYHGYSVGNRVYLTGIAGALGSFLNGRVWDVVSVIDANSFTIDADTRTLAAFTSADGGQVRTGPPTPDPTPPVVPDPVPTPDPPIVAPGGGSKWGVDRGQIP